MQTESMMHLSTEGIEEQYRLSNWVQYITNFVGKGPDPFKPAEVVHSQPLGKGEFEGNLESGSLGSLQLSRLRVSPHRFRRSLNAPTSFAATPILLVVQLNGVTCLKSSGAKEYLEPGSAFIFDTRNTFEISNDEYSDQLVVAIPRNSLSVANGFFNTLGHKLCNDHGLTKLLYGMLSESIFNYDSLNLDSKISLGQSVLQLLPNILDQGTVEDIELLGTSADITTQAVKNYIEQHLDDPLLTIERIAEANNCSVRTIHRLFKHCEIGGVGHYIWDRRLRAAARKLIDPGFSHCSITDIAFSWGFSSSAHFSRCFKVSYGMTPRAYRNAELLMKCKNA